MFGFNLIKVFSVRTIAFGKQLGVFGAIFCLTNSGFVGYAIATASADIVFHRTSITFCENMPRFS